MAPTSLKDALKACSVPPEEPTCPIARCMHNSIPDLVYPSFGQAGQSHPCATLRTTLLNALICPMTSRPGPPATSQIITQKECPEISGTMYIRFRLRHPIEKTILRNYPHRVYLPVSTWNNLLTKARDGIEAHRLQ